MITRAGLFLAMLQVAACDRAPTGPPSEANRGGPLMIERFVQYSPDSMWLVLSRDVEVAGVASTPGIARTMSENQVSQFAYERLLQKEGALKIELNEHRHSAEWSVIVVMIPERCRQPLASGDTRFRIKRDCDDLQYVEFVRQPVSWLRETGGIDSKNGNTILGRRNVLVRDRKLVKEVPIVFQGTPNVELRAIDLKGLPSTITRYPELATSARIVRWLWREKLRVGPIPASISYEEFVNLPLSRKLRLLRAGEFAVMCQGLRDLFLHATLADRSLRVRAVQAYDHAPPFAHLITYSHAASEVYVGELGKWVLVDPWMGVMLAGPDGMPLSASEIRGAGAENLRLIPVASRANWFITTQGDKPTAYSPDTRKILFDEWDGSNPGYLTFYKQLIYLDVKLASDGEPAISPY